MCLRPECSSEKQTVKRCGFEAVYGFRVSDVRTERERESSKMNMQPGWTIIGNRRKHA